jgi:hypothetical protein
MLHVGNHILIFFLAHLAKDNVGILNHFASVVCCLSSVNFSHFNLIRNMNCLWRSCLLSDRDEMSNRYRGPSMDASYQVSIHLANQKQELPVAAMFVNR